MYDQEQPARRSWRTATERDQELARAPSWRTATWGGGESAQQRIRIADAWSVAASPTNAQQRAAAVAELLRAAGDAKWTVAELERWLDEKLDDVAAARAAVLEELRTRLAARRSEAA